MSAGFVLFTVELLVTNFNRNFTGVSATAAAVARRQRAQYAMQIVGKELPGCPAPVGLGAAFRLARRPNPGRPFVIWHVRRNAEMLSAIIARDILRLPVKIVFTSSAQRLHSAFPRWLISRMDAVIATTQEAATFVPHVRAIAPHGVDTDQFRPAADRARAWAETRFPGVFGIAAIGRVRPEKGTDRFVDAMISVLPDLSGATALIIGRTMPEHAAFAADLNKRVKEAGLDGRIIFTGEMPPDRLAALLPALSLHVALPRYEGYGMTVLETMAAGVPVVASDAGNFREFIAEGRSGHIVADGEVAEVVKKALEILRTDGAVERMGKEARKRVEKHFSIECEVEAIDGVYEALWSAPA